MGGLGDGTRIYADWGMGRGFTRIGGWDADLRGLADGTRIYADWPMGRGFTRIGGWDADLRGLAEGTRIYVDWRMNTDSGTGDEEKTRMRTMEGRDYPAPTVKIGVFLK